MATLTVNGLVFSGGARSDSGLYFSDLTDWFSLSDSKSEVHERAQAHGAFGIANDYRQSLAISFKGWCIKPTRLEGIQAKNTLKLALGANRPVLATLDDEDGPTSRMVSIRAVPLPDNRWSKVFTFDVDMIAFDPLAYGPTVTQQTGPAVSGGGLLFPLGTTPAKYWDFGTDGTSGRIIVTNNGTAPTWPQLRALGGMGLGFIATDVDTAQVVRFDRAIPEDSMVTIDQRTGTASIDGASNDVTGFLTLRDFFSIPPGASHQIQFSVLGSASGTPQFFADSAKALL